MRALRGGIPRAFRSHRTPIGAAYGRYCRAWMVRFGGSVPADARADLQQAGILAARDLPYLNAAVERTRGKRRNSLERKLKSARVQLVMFERQLAARLNGHHPDGDLARAFAEHESS